MEIFWRTIAYYNSATWLLQIVIILTVERFPISIDRERMGLTRTRNTLRLVLCGQAQTLNVEVNMLHWRML